jgi:hypothetical protein
MFVVGTALVNGSTSAVLLESRHPTISDCSISVHSWYSSRQHQAGAGSLKLVDGERRFFPLRVSYPRHSRHGAAGDDKTAITEAVTASTAFQAPQKI